MAKLPTLIVSELVFDENNPIVPIATFKTGAVDLNDQPITRRYELHNLQADQLQSVNDIPVKADVIPANHQAKPTLGGAANNETYVEIPGHLWLAYNRAIINLYENSHWAEVKNNNVKNEG